MANEIKVTGSGTVTNGEYKQTWQAFSLNIDQAAIGAHSSVVIVGTSEENMPVGDVGTEGWLFLKNLDATNYVEWGPDDTGMVAIGRLEPGEHAMFRMKPGATLRWIANTAQVKVQMLLLED